MPRKPASKYRAIDLFNDGKFLPDAMVAAIGQTPEQRDAELLASATRGLQARAEAKRQAAAARLAQDIAKVSAAAPVGIKGAALAKWLRNDHRFGIWDARRIARVVTAIGSSF